MTRARRCFKSGWAMLLAVAALHASAQQALTERSFADAGAGSGIVILQVNWGRYWKCGPYENAQLQRLAFRRLSAAGDDGAARDWVLEPRSALLSQPTYTPYVYLLEPGEYALSGFKLKVAASVSDVRVANVESERLIVDGKPVGGSFSVAAGEIVYIGHFGVGCAGEPTLWRLYVDGRPAFDSYVGEFRQQYPYSGDIPITFRLFASEHFGTPYELPP